jgi:hypothetical protein
MHQDKPDLHPWRDRIAFSHFIRHVDDDYLEHIDSATEADLLRFLILQNFEQEKYLRRISRLVLILALPLILSVFYLLLLWWAYATADSSDGVIGLMFN